MTSPRPQMRAALHGRYGFVEPDSYLKVQFFVEVCFRLDSKTTPDAILYFITKQLNSNHNASSRSEVRNSTLKTRLFYCLLHSHITP